MYSWAQFRSSWNSTICNGDHSAGRDFSPASQSCLHGDIRNKEPILQLYRIFSIKKDIPVECSSAYLFGQENGHNRIIPCMEDKGGALDAGDVNVAVKRHVVTLQPLGEEPVDDGQWPIELPQHRINSMKRVIRSRGLYSIVIENKPLLDISIFTRVSG